mmetsp:Transcript_139024/g.252785  ORF Transcript_139024/g.252785 Transcript_139024/m.252785 type:complete len:161 (+) Transcript_139024:18-500(+)
MCSKGILYADSHGAMLSATSHKKTFAKSSFCARHIGHFSRRSAQALQQQTWRQGMRRISRGASQQTTQLYALCFRILGFVGVLGGLASGLTGGWYPMAGDSSSQASVTRGAAGTIRADDASAPPLTLYCPLSSRVLLAAPMGAAATTWVIKAPAPTPALC